MSIVKALFLPPGCFLVLFLGALVLHRRRPRAGMGLMGTAALLLYAASTPIVGEGALYLLAAGQPAPARIDSARGGAIVVLAGDFEATPDGDAPGALSLERLWRAARIHRATDAPVLVSGGPMAHLRTATAATMARVLARDFRVRARWQEKRSRNTWQNAKFSADILTAEGVRRVYLVTHGWHLPRARFAFERHDLAVIPVPVRAAVPPSPAVDDFLPRASALQASYFASHEVIGLWWYHLRHGGV